MASSFDWAITSGNLSRRLISHFSEIQVKKKGKQYVGRTVEPKRPQRLDIDGGATSSPNPTLAEKKTSWIQLRPFVFAGSKKTTPSGGN